MTDPVHKGRRVLVSGGTSGIGLACARRFLAEGAAVCILGSHQRTVDEALDGLDGDVFGCACDVASQEETERAFELVDERLQGLDVAFVNAGIDGEGKPASELDAEHFRRVLEVNVIGSFLTARAAVQRMETGGRLIFNASVNALRPERDFADYNASKAAVASLAQTMGIELAGQGITSLAVCPGYVPTRMTAPYMGDEQTTADLLDEVPAGRFASPDEIASLVSYLATDGGAYMSGSLVSIDGGRGV